MLLLQLLSFFFNGEHTDLVGGLIAAAIGCLSGIAVAIAWDFLSDIPVGVTAGIWLGFWMEICTTISWRGSIVILLSTIGGLALGTVMKKPTVVSLESNASSIHRFDEKLKTSKDVKSRASALVDAIGARVVAFSGGRSQLIEEYPVGRIGKTISLSIIVGLFLAFVVNFINGDLASIIVLNTLIVFPAGIMGGFAMNLIEKPRSSMAVGVGGGILIGTACGAWSGVLSFIIALLPCIVTTMVWLVGLSIGMGAAEDRTEHDGQEPLLPVLAGVAIGVPFAVFSHAAAVIVGCIFIICYVISSYQLPLYPINIISAKRTEEAMEVDPSHAVGLLSQSTFHREEFISLPLNYVEKRLSKAIELGDKQSGRIMVRTAQVEQADLFPLCPLFYWENCLACVAKQDVEQALREIAYIMARRPFLIKAAQAGLREILLEGIRKRGQGQKERKTLRDVAELSGYLHEFRSQWGDIIPPEWLEDLNRLNYASEDADRFLHSLSWDARHGALKNMVKDLQSVKANRLERISQGWIGAARHELNKLEQEPHYVGINNPYIDSQALQPRSPLFKGRGEVLEQLEQSLERVDQRATFFLNGERRMGKTSMLRQLSSQLNPRSFIPIVYDLQGPEMTANIAIFLGAVADKIWWPTLSRQKNRLN